MQQNIYNSPPVQAAPPSAEQLPPDKKGMSARAKKIIIAIAAVMVIAAAAGLIGVAMRGNDDTSSPRPAATSQEDQFAQQYVRNCNQQRQVTFSAPPVPFDQLGYIEPMGKMSDGHVTPTDHVYITPKNQMAADNTTNVVMPADGTVIGVSAMPAQYIGDKNQQTAPEDHRLVVAHNCQYVSIFIHVHKLSDALRSAIGGPLQPNTQKEISVDVKAGELLGTIGGNPVDWSLMDATKTLSGFVTPGLYKSEPWKIHVIDPLSVYSGAVKERLIAASLRGSTPYGGKIDFDKKGTLSGNWFREGTNGYSGADQQRYWDGHLAIAPNHIDPAATMVSLGNWEGKAAQFVAKNATDPLAITMADGAVAYELSPLSYIRPDGRDWQGQEFVKGLTVRKNEPVKGVILLQVMEAEKLKVEVFPGKTAAQVQGFTAAASIYSR